MEPVKVIQGKKVTVKVYRDTDPLNPREDYDNLGTMIHWHPRYNLGDKRIAKDQYANPEQVKEFEVPEGSIVLPLYLYDHSGITMSTEPFSCPWDSGQVGFIFVSPDRIKEEYGKDDEASREIAERVLRGEVKEFDQYLRGDVYFYEVVEKETGEHLESIGGFFGEEAIDEEVESLLADESALLVES